MTMRLLLIILVNIFLITATTSCSVISREVKSDARPQVPFKTLLQEIDTYKGQTVILGGYILETSNLQSETILKVLQTPLRIGEEPETRDRSEGRFIVFYKGFLDPEVYSKDRTITVAGIVLGSSVEKIGDNQITYLNIENREIYLWPDYETQRPPFYPGPYPYYWYRYPYYPHPYWYW